MPTGVKPASIAYTDPALCKACNICVRACPLRVISVRGGCAVLVGECNGCGKCIGYCPFKARVLVPSA